MTRITLLTRPAGSQGWTQDAMALVGRRTFGAELTLKEAAKPLLDYYVEAEFRSRGAKVLATAPLEAPARFYTVTLL